MSKRPNQESSPRKLKKMNKIVTVALRDQRISPKKARLVIDFVRGMKAEEAQSALGRLEKKGARDVARLLNNAVDAAKNKDYKIEDLYICESICQEGRKLKRFQVLARGRSTQFKKRMSHLKISLSKVEEKTENEKAPNKREGKKTADIKHNRIATINNAVKKDK